MRFILHASFHVRVPAWNGEKRGEQEWGRYVSAGKVRAENIHSWALVALFLFSYLFLPFALVLLARFLGRWERGASCPGCLWVW